MSELENSYPLKNTKEKTLTLDDYTSKSSEILEKTDKLIELLFQNFQNAVQKNSKTIINLVYSDPNFKLIARDGTFINILERDSDYERIIELENNIYFNLTNGCLYQYDSSETVYHSEFLNIVPNCDEIIRQYFKDIEFYKDVMHIVGLSGILAASLQYQKNILDNIETMLQ